MPAQDAAARGGETAGSRARSPIPLRTHGVDIARQTGPRVSIPKWLSDIPRSTVHETCKANLPVIPVPSSTSLAHQFPARRRNQRGLAPRVSLTQISVAANSGGAPGAICDQQRESAGSHQFDVQSNVTAGARLGLAFGHFLPLTASWPAVGRTLRWSTAGLLAGCGVKAARGASWPPSPVPPPVHQFGGELAPMRCRRTQKMISVGSRGGRPVRLIWKSAASEPPVLPNSARSPLASRPALSWPAAVKAASPMKAKA